MTTTNAFTVDKTILDLCFFQISGISVAFEASRVSEFVDQQDEIRQVDTLDVGWCLGLGPPSKGIYCQKAIMNIGDRELVLVLGPKLRIERVEMSRLYRLPRIVQAMERLTGICGIVLHSNTFSFLLDIDSLIKCR